MPDSPPHTGQRRLTWLRRYTWWFLIPYPLTAATVGTIQAIRHDHPGGVLALILIAFAVATVVSVRWFDAVTRHEARDWPTLADWVLFAVAAAGLAGTAWLISPFPYRPLGWLLLASALTAAVILRLPARHRLAALVVMTGLIAAATALLARAGLAAPLTVLGVAALVASFAAIIWVQWWSFDVARQLEQARSVAAELAVTRERLRFAADLHDIQGHHLQVIALKSELAARLGGRDPDKAVALMREVQDLARDALSDTRAVVAGYRSVSPGTEITNATKVLTAAGIEATANLPGTDPGRGFAGERELGLLIREATTNILRHARPTRAEFDLTATGEGLSVRIRNDGADSGATSGDGTGLAGLRDRFEAVGGSLDWRSEAGRFTVSARLPRAAAPPDPGRSPDTEGSTR
ncbi:sensor histidine kinase [Stackebrandtia nassauensis]|uniref:Histidine kinase n=1 Tax=Stackebrandtia nassauensis (strain DSM 44728 / CIP 108903 / NRRL B-16338 / NBRC 102104 / LLR-40K-21) TaxID=446470 RepID=D3Q5S0_STANL|nr:histidine kinase [Stackebrandtia nassauensis]ADD40219.1 histidine kinase [Stackebrandtia nassauensis DSM 44728]